MFLLSKFLLCIECYRIVDKYYRQNKEVTVITLVWSICSNWITASELDLEIITSLTENIGVVLRDVLLC